MYQDNNSNKEWEITFRKFSAIETEEKERETWDKI